MQRQYSPTNGDTYIPMSIDKKLVLAIDPLFNGLHGGEIGRMKTLNEVKMENLDLIEKESTNIQGNKRLKD